MGFVNMFQKRKSIALVLLLAVGVHNCSYGVNFGIFSGALTVFQKAKNGFVSTKNYVKEMLL